MHKIDKVVWQECGYIAAWTLIFSVFMQAVFLIVGQWNITVLLGNVYTAAVVVLNYFLLCLTVQKALEKDEKDAKQFIKASSSVRLLALFGLVVLGVVLDCFHIIAVLIPLLFPRVAIMLRPFWDKRRGGEDVPAVETNDNEEADLSAEQPLDDGEVDNVEERGQ